jgi:hypothetical protein
LTVYLIVLRAKESYFYIRTLLKTKVAHNNTSIKHRTS